MIVHERQGVENIELGLVRDDHGVSDEVLQPSLQHGTVLIQIGLEGDIGGVVEQICSFEEVVLRVTYDRRGETVEREEVCDLVCLWVLLMRQTY